MSMTLFGTPPKVSSCQMLGGKIRAISDFLEFAGVPPTS
ncbi:hypothetical protein COO91_04024 [Nostoc flagelliforme CCNUN1]|uniref:Uncharacterized protein n=1 Tax=Nostoc flagelliforme CCNUN1 TaxID=2038116 RepID=A0A2K8STE5_9NOSO|nr:hypothetical protein COO91_04024 [Nostoc flagelliforme CCNUN1]